MNTWNTLLLIGKKSLLSLLILQGILMSASIKHIQIDTINVPVIFEEQRSLPTFNVQLIFQNSGYIQDKKKPGLASISAKLLNEGTKKQGSVNFAQKLEEKAISLSASTGFETFVIELSSLKDVRKDALALLQKVLIDPNYSKDTLLKLKTLQVGALKRKENDFDYVSKNILKASLFKNTPLANPASGTIESVESISLNDIKKFINKSINLSNLIVVAGGDLDFKTLKKEISPMLKTLQVGKNNSFKTFSANDKAKEETLLKDTQQAYIYFGSPFNITVQDKDAHMAKVASFILGGAGFGSRLMEEIRVKRGLAYSAYGYISVNKSHSYFTGYLQTKNETADEAKKLVSQIVNDFVINGVTQEELDAAKNFLTGSEPLRVETLSQRLNRAFTYFYRGLDQDYAKQELKKIEILSLEDLNAYIKSHTEIQSLSYSIVRK
jgi:predicted Zn-dependent peptidase